MAESAGGHVVDATAGDSHPTIAELVSLRTRTALVTGGAKGIGLAVSRRLYEAGASVFLGGTDGEAARCAAAELRGGPGVAAGGVLDVGDPEIVDRVTAEICSTLGPIDILVNNAGVFPPATLSDLDLESWQRVTRVNLDGALLCSRAFARHIATSGRGGVIINISSLGGSRASAAGMAAYVASKHGLEGLTKALAVELGPTGVRVISVAPTFVPTPGAMANIALSGAAVSDYVATIPATIPLRRVATADDVARAVLFCASDLSSFVTGSTIFVDGGSMAV